ncbi:hypothetical protein AVEN_111188-1 [Araneus ventricosus]|uniref:Uncharacterized protein n=1 Tax=Araneus ventricosus TaxID=182803 RepID=A0A4Y2T4W4_ARAVE|nr:hypothetical protein AVEN_111188-1 [Araneus ventricosus]
MSSLPLFHQKNLPSLANTAFLNPAASRQAHSKPPIFLKSKGTVGNEYLVPSGANLAKYFTSGYFAQLISESLTNWNEAVLSVTNPEISFNWENWEILKELLLPSCQSRAEMGRVMPCVNGFASISSFLESCFRSSSHDGFLQISSKKSYPISSHRRGTCFTNLSQDERGVSRAVSRTVHHIPVVSALCGGRVNIKDLPRPGQVHVVTNSATISAVGELIRQNRRVTTREIAVELSISKGTVYHIIHKTLGMTKFVHSGWPNICRRIRRRREWVFA